MGPEAVQEIYDLLDEVDSKVETLTNTINAILDWVPWGLGWAADKFRDLWDGAVTKLGEFWDTIRGIVAQIGAPWQLNSTKDSWIEVGGPVAAHATEFTRGQSDVDYEWQGRAADRYAMALTEQSKALASVRDKLTAPLGPALGDIATALYVFFGAVAFAIVALIAGIVLATGEAVSILGLIAVPPTVITAVIAAIAAIGGATINMLGAANSANTVFSNLRTNTPDFGPSNWPAAVVG